MSRLCDGHSQRLSPRLQWLRGLSRKLPLVGRSVHRRSLSLRFGTFLFHIETNGKQTLAVFDGASHLSALRKVACVKSSDDVRIEGMAASFTVPALVV